jgi:cytosine/adenosine deaminase-related metal-dependent hydrolase
MAEFPCRTLRARYVFTGLGPPIAAGTLTLCGPRIVAVGRDLRGDVEDLGNVAILPGLVNAHTHLELSDLDAPLGTRGMGLVDWIGLVIAHRQRRPLADPVAQGIAESGRLGTTSLGEIAQPGWPAEVFRTARLDATVFLELIAPTAARVEPAIELARGHLALPLPSGEGWGEGTLEKTGSAGSQQAGGMGSDALYSAPADVSRVSSAGPTGVAAGANNLSQSKTGSWHSVLGLSPHAPYSVHPELLRQLVRLAQTAGSPLAFHLAESREELGLLATGEGPFREMLRKMGVGDDRQFPAGRRPLDYLQELAAAPRTLVIHGNYLREEEIRFLADHAGRMSLVYCPRTHAFFHHAPYPLAKLLASGVRMALGTDSRASSPDLSILAEMRFLARQHPEIGRPTILQLGTLGGAQALGVDRSVGTLEPGKLAHLAIVALADRDAEDPYDLLFDGDAPVVGRWWRGAPDASSPPRNGPEE